MKCPRLNLFEAFNVIAVRMHFTGVRFTKVFRTELGHKYTFPVELDEGLDGRGWGRGS